MYKFPAFYHWQESWRIPSATEAGPGPLRMNITTCMMYCDTMMSLNNRIAGEYPGDVLSYCYKKTYLVKVLQ